MDVSQDLLDLISLLELEVSGVSGGHYIRNRAYRQLNRRGPSWIGQTIDLQPLTFFSIRTFYEVLLSTKHRVRFPVFSEN